MGGQPTRNLSDREMRSLALKEFLTLIQEDIRELDEQRRQRRKLDRDEKPVPPSGRKGRQKALEASEPEEEEPIIPLSLHVVACCGKRLGSFASMARVRCPFCERWHRAGDFPEDNGT